MNGKGFCESVQATLTQNISFTEDHKGKNSGKPSPKTVVRGISAAVAEHCYPSEDLDCHTYMDGDEATLSVSGTTLPTTLVELLVSCSRTITTALHAVSNDCDRVALCVQFDEEVYQYLRGKDSLFKGACKTCDAS